MRVQMAIVIGVVLAFGGARAQISPPVSGNTQSAPASEASAPPQPIVRTPADNPEPPGTIHGPERQPVRRRAHQAARVNETANITLNFPGVDVHEAAKAILGDILGLNYAVDPSVSGAITVVTANPVRKSDVFPILEDSLKAANLGLVRRGAVYTIVPLAEAKRQPQLVGPEDAGYGTESVQLHYVGATELKKLLEPMVPENSITQIDPGRNIILITGSAGERASIRGLIEQFDVNWLQGMSFAMFVPKHTDSKLIIPQLDQLLNGQNAPTEGLVRLLSVDRLNGILAISKQPQYLKDVGRWVDMLDREGEEGTRRLFVYRVQNGRASDLATVLVNAFGASSAAGNQAAQATGNKYPNGLSRPNPVGTFQSPQNSGGPMGAAQTPNGGTSPFDRLGSASSDALGSQPTAVTGQTLQLGPTGAPVTLTSDDSNNAIVVYGTSSEYTIIEDALRKLDVQPMQVMIQAAITEVTLTDQMQYGIQWAFQAGTANFNIGKGNVSATDATTGIPTGPGFTYLMSYGTSINATLTELAGMTKINVLSAPNLVVLNNHTAALEVGQQVPISTGSATSTLTSGAPIVNSIDYRDTGVILQVTPRVNDGGLVLLDISQEVSDVASTTTSTLDSPTINERKIASSIAVHDGQTVALGGLITTNDSNASSGLPFLRNIPVIGNFLFDSTNNNSSRTELIVLLTPRVIRNEAEAKSVTEELKEELKNMKPSTSAK